MSLPPRPESPVKAEDDGLGPMARFRSLAGALLRVPYRAVQEERSRYKRSDDDKGGDEGS